MHIIALNRTWVIHWRWLLVTLIVFCLLLGLAFWQLQRAAYKQEISARLEQLQLAGKINAQQLRNLSSAEADGVRIAVPAHWYAPYAWLLDNQMVNGKIGYDLIVPMQLDTTGDIVLVNLGWLAAPLKRTDLPQINVPKYLSVDGILRTHSGGFAIGSNIELRTNWPMRIQRIAIDDLSVQIKTPFYAGVVYQLQGSPYAIHYQPVIMSAERHRAYALQWLLLAAAVLVVAASASLKAKDSLMREKFNVR